MLAEVPLRPEVHRLRRPLHGQRHRRHVAERPHHLPEGPRLRQPDLQDHLLRSTTHAHSNASCSRPCAGRRHRRRRAHAAVSADEAKALGTTLTADRRREGRQQGRHDPRVHRRPDHAAGRLQGGRRHPPEPVRRREAAPGDRRQEHGAARRQADRGHQGAAAEVPDLPRRRVPDAPHASRFPKCVADNTAKNATGAKTHQRRPLDRRRARRLPVPDPEDRLRGDVEPPGALQRPGLRGQVPQPEASTPAAAPTLATEGVSVAGIPVLGQQPRPRPTPSGASSSPTPARRAAPARR